MKTHLAAALIFLAAPVLSAKGRTVKITLTAPNRPTIELTGDHLTQFHIWSGPGVTINGVEQTEGFIIDWKQSAAPARPAGSLRFDVAFYKQRDAEPASLAYVVTYEHDPATGQGYVYLPGPADPHYALNTNSILRRGYDGNWFPATTAWRNFIAPNIARPKMAAD